MDAQELIRKARESGAVVKAAQSLIVAGTPDFHVLIEGRGEGETIPLIIDEFHRLGELDAPCAHMEGAFSLYDFREGELKNIAHMAGEWNAYRIGGGIVFQPFIHD